MDFWQGVFWSFGWREIVVKCRRFRCRVFKSLKPSECINLSERIESIKFVLVFLFIECVVAPFIEHVGGMFEEGARCIRAFKQQLEIVWCEWVHRILCVVFLKKREHVCFE